jgi:4-hydroxymandelate oxidase
VLPLLAAQRAAAHDALPAETLAAYETGTWAEQSVEEAGWSHLRLRPRVLRDVSSIDTSLTLLGMDLPHPVIVAPTAFHGLAHPDGEHATAAGAAGALTIVSTRASVGPLQTGADPWWLQVYVLRDRGATTEFVTAAAAAGARALVLTADTPYLGPKARGAFPDVATRAAGVQQDPALTFDTIGWLAEASGLPVLVKGVLRGDDAEHCVTAGAAGIVVSNHGGRQLDRAVRTCDALPEVVDTVGGRVPVLVDGGIRSGLDALCALALGADAVCLGKPVLWALAAGGADGVRDCLGAVAEDLRTAMALAGATTLAQVTPDLIA